MRISVGAGSGPSSPSDPHPVGWRRGRSAGTVPGKRAEGWVCPRPAVLRQTASTKAGKSATFWKWLDTVKREEEMAVETRVEPDVARRQLKMFFEQTLPVS